MQFSRAGHSPPPPGKKRRKQASQTPAFCRVGSPSLWRAPSLPLPPGPLSSILYPLLPSTHRRRQVGRLSVKVLLLGKNMKKEISVTEANPNQPSGRLPGSLAEPQGLKTQTLSTLPSVEGASKSLHSKCTWLRCVFLKRLIPCNPRQTLTLMFTWGF